MASPTVGRLVAVFGFSFPSVVFVCFGYALLSNRVFFPAEWLRRALWRVAPRKVMHALRTSYVYTSCCVFVSAHLSLLWHTWPAHDPCRDDAFKLIEGVAVMSMSTILLTFFIWIDRVVGAVLSTPPVYDFDLSLRARTARATTAAISWHAMSVRAPTIPLLLLTATAGRVRTVFPRAEWYVRALKLTAVLISVLILSGECPLPSRTDAAAAAIGALLV